MAMEHQYLRWTKDSRYQHWVMVAAFLILTLTGLPQKYPESGISIFTLRLMGGLEFARILHRIAAVTLMVVAVYHAGALLYYWLVLRGKPHLLPGVEDLKNALGIVKHNLGLQKERPKQSVFTFEEKFEYWALIWGTLVMVITGFFLWNPITASAILPAAWIPVAKAAHGGEALLAVLAIIIWHMYHVLVKHFNTSMFTGFISRHEMEEEHAAALESGDYEMPVVNENNPAFQERRTQFLRVYGVVAALLFVGIVWFVTTEQTALAEPAPVPDLVNLQVYHPLAPTETPDPGLGDYDVTLIGTTWENGIGEMLINSCGACHQGEGSVRNLDLRSYAGALAGGDSGPAVKSGAPGASPVTVFIQLEDHPMQLSPNQFAALWYWIENGAPEN